MGTECSEIWLQEQRDVEWHGKLFPFPYLSWIACAKCERRLRTTWSSEAIWMHPLKHGLTKSLFSVRFSELARQHIIIAGLPQFIVCPQSGMESSHEMFSLLQERKQHEATLFSGNPFNGWIRSEWIRTLQLYNSNRCLFPLNRPVSGQQTQLPPVRFRSGCASWKLIGNSAATVRGASNFWSNPYSVPPSEDYHGLDFKSLSGRNTMSSQ